MNVSRSFLDRLKEIPEVERNVHLASCGPPDELQHVPFALGRNVIVEDEHEEELGFYAR